VTAATAAESDGAAMTGSERPVETEARYDQRQYAERRPASTASSAVQAGVTGARVKVVDRR